MNPTFKNLLVILESYIQEVLTVGLNTLTSASLTPRGSGAMKGRRLFSDCILREALSRDGTGVIRLTNPIAKIVRGIAAN